MTGRLRATGSQAGADAARPDVGREASRIYSEPPIPRLSSVHMHTVPYPLARPRTGPKGEHTSTSRHPPIMEW